MAVGPVPKIWIYRFEDHHNLCMQATAQQYFGTLTSQGQPRQGAQHTFYMLKLMGTCIST